MARADRVGSVRVVMCDEPVEVEVGDKADMRLVVAAAAESRTHVLQAYCSGSTSSQCLQGAGPAQWDLCLYAH